MAIDITPSFALGGIAQLGKSYADNSARMMIETGKNIEAGLAKMTTNRQLQGLGNSLGQLDPNSADWPQQAVAVSSQYPMALQTEAGHMLISTQAKAHAQWQAAQAATQAMGTRFQNQKTLLGMRGPRSTGGGEVDLSGIFGGGSPLQPQNPATGISIGTDETLPSTPMDTTGANAGAPANIDAEGSLLPPVDFQAGAKPSGGGVAIPDRLQPQSPAAGLAADNVDPLAVAEAPGITQEESSDPLVRRALAPLWEVQRRTGAKPKSTQIAAAIAKAKSEEQAQAIQDQREAIADKKASIKEQQDAERAKQAEMVQQRLILTGQLSNIERDITQHRSALTAHKSKLKDIRKLDEAERPAAIQDFYAQQKELESTLEEAGKERTRINKELNNLGKERKAEEDTPVAVAPSKPTYKFDIKSGILKPL